MTHEYFSQVKKIELFSICGHRKWNPFVLSEPHKRTRKMKMKMKMLFVQNDATDILLCVLKLSFCLASAISFFAFMCDSVLFRLRCFLLIFINIFVFCVCVCVRGFVFVIFMIYGEQYVTSNQLSDTISNNGIYGRRDVQLNWMCRMKWNSIKQKWNWKICYKLLFAAARRNYFWCENGSFFSILFNGKLWDKAKSTNQKTTEN